MRYDCLIIDDEKLLADSTAEYFNLFGVKTHFIWNYLHCLICQSTDVLWTKPSYRFLGFHLLPFFHLSSVFIDPVGFFV